METTTTTENDSAGTIRPHACHQEQLVSLRRIEGQVRGIAKMIDDGKYCVDIISQVRAARSALATVESKILAKHVENCVKSAMDSGSSEVVKERLEEVIQYVTKSLR